MIGGDLNSDVILCCQDSSRPISRAHPASARSSVLTNYQSAVQRVRRSK